MPSRRDITRAASAPGGTGVRSSSLKAISASRWTRTSISPFRRDSIRRDSSPFNWEAATFRAASVRAAIMSATASAWVRSMRPFRKARFVNSPGSAGRAPA
jgi:hypothetical protein